MTDEQNKPNTENESQPAEKPVKIPRDDVEEALRDLMEVEPDEAEKKNSAPR